MPSERDIEKEPWWVHKRPELLSLAEQHINAYVYDLDTVAQKAGDIQSLGAVDRTLFAVKANFNTDIIRTLAGAGVDFDCVSPGEVRMLRDVLSEDCEGRILFTPNFAPRDEYEWALREGLCVTIDNLYPLKHWPEVFADREIFVRIDPDYGAGHHKHVITAGVTSKFGVSIDEIDELVTLVNSAGSRVVGIHAHSGSGILDPQNWQSVAAVLAEVAGRFPGVRALDLGGGIGVPDQRGGPDFDLAALDELLGKVKAEYPDYALWLEPGRYLVSQAGVLIAHVTQMKEKGGHCYVGVSAGFNSLIRPALYDAYHEIVNLTQLDANASETVTVVGPICETGDTFGTERALPPSNEGDVMLIANTGAYGYVMSSRYNLRDIPKEITI